MVTHTTPRWSPWRGRTRPDPAQPVPVDRASPADLMQLATDVGPAPMHVGAVLTLGTGPGFSVVEAGRLLSERVRAVPRLRQGLAELGGARPLRRLPPTSLNRPTGPQRRLDVVAADLAAVRDLGHAHGGTVNDVILAAIAGALRALLASRGEQLDLVTVSVPVSARQVATGGQLGNQVGVMPAALPTSGGLAARVTRIAAITRDRKTTARGTSAALLGPPFRLLAPTGLLHLFVNRQRLIHTFATNLRGPAEPLTFAGAPVRAVIPIPNTTGNVTVTFGVLSYAGTLRITVLSDPSRVPDVAVLTAALRRELGSAAR